jgi:hypothetical protein
MAKELNPVQSCYLSVMALGESIGEAKVARMSEGIYEGEGGEHKHKIYRIENTTKSIKYGLDNVEKDCHIKLTKAREKLEAMLAESTKIAPIDIQDLGFLVEQALKRKGQ